VNEFTYVAPAVISSVTPSSGHLGTHVTLRGTNMLMGAPSLSSVTLGGVAARIVSANSSVIELVAGGSSSAILNGDVVLIASTDATTTLTGGWTYVSPGDIDSIAPSIGSLNTIVTIAGSGLLGGGTTTQSVTLAGIPVRSIVSVSASEIVVIANLSATSLTGDVVIISDSGAIVTQASGWTYISP
jgi:hypothetical protein